jgi:hypothetical protein
VYIVNYPQVAVAEVFEIAYAGILQLDADANRPAAICPRKRRWLSPARAPRPSILSAGSRGGEGPARAKSLFRLGRGGSRRGDSDSSRSSSSANFTSAMTKYICPLDTCDPGGLTSCGALSPARAHPP